MPFTGALAAARWEADVLRSTVPVAVLFWAEWCVPCRTVLPYFERAAERGDGGVRLATLDVDQAPEVAERYAVRGLPTLLLLRDGREVGRRVGLIPEDKLRSALQSLR